MTPTKVRYLVVAVTALAAMWMYIDRVCFSTLAEPIGEELGVDRADMSYVLGAFFFTYALFQIPIGSLADRYGPRVILTACIVAWSLCTAATAVAGGVMALFAVRLCLGACEAGAYPAAAGLVRRWAAATERGFLSSMVAFGGRIGGAIAPIVTAFAAVTWLGTRRPGSGMAGRVRPVRAGRAGGRLVVLDRRPRQPGAHPWRTRPRRPGAGRRPTPGRGCRGRSGCSPWS